MDASLLGNGRPAGYWVLDALRAIGRGGAAIG